MHLKFFFHEFFVRVFTRYMMWRISILIYHNIHIHPTKTQFQKKCQVYVICSFLYPAIKWPGVYSVILSSFCHFIIFFLSFSHFVILSSLTFHYLSNSCTPLNGCVIRICRSGSNLEIMNFQFLHSNFGRDVDIKLKLHIYRYFNRKYRSSQVR